MHCEVDLVAKNRLPSSYELADFRTIEQWIESGLGGSQFDRFDKVAYLIRLHRDELVESGELVVGRGARPTLLGPRFGKVAMRLLRRQADVPDARAITRKTRQQNAMKARRERRDQGAP